MRVIGIDQSYTAFAYSVDGEAKKKAFPASKYNGDLDRLYAIRKWFTGWMDDQVNRFAGSVDLVVMEGYAHGAKVGRELAGELGGVVKLAVMDTWGSPPLIVPPPSLKKFVTGVGNAKKNQMIAHVYKKWGVMFSDDNEADAFSLEKFGKAYLQHTGARVSALGTPMALLKYEIEAIDKVRHLV